jgi:hypothetical protein
LAARLPHAAVSGSFLLITIVTIIQIAGLPAGTHEISYRARSSSQCSPSQAAWRCTEARLRQAELQAQQ